MTDAVHNMPRPRVALHRLIGVLIVIPAVAWAAWTWSTQFEELALHRDVLEALEHEDRAVLASLVERGVDPDRPLTCGDNRAGRTLLTMATQRGQVDMARFVLELGADPDRPDRSGLTALRIAAGAGRAELTTLLLDQGADVDLASRDVTALIAAALRGEAAVVDLLLERGADPRKPDHQGRTPILVASHATCDLDTFRRIVDEDVDVTAQTWYTTPLVIAADDLDPPNTRAAQEQKVKLLVEAGADVEAKDYRGRTPLMLAARCSAPATKTLLDAGAGQQFPDHYGMSALHWAASDGDDETVRLLLEAGADPNVSHGRNSTPLDHAKGRNDAEGKKIVKRLEEAHPAMVSPPEARP